MSSKQVQFTYDNDSQVRTITSYSGTSQVAVGTYADNQDGELTGLNYTHDGSAITTGGFVINYTVEYDAAGNVTEVVSADGTDNYTVNSSDQLDTASLTSESYSYDQNGNRTNDGYQTGADNRLLSDVESGVVYDYQYDADGNRIARWTPATAGAGDPAGAGRYQHHDFRLGL